MKKYELAVLLHPDLEIDIEASLKRLDDILAEVKADVRQRDEWGKRKLAYRIAKQNYAIYVFYRFECKPTKTASLDRLLRLNDEVLRYLLVEQEAPPKAEKEAKRDKNKSAATNAGANKTATKSSKADTEPAADDGEAKKETATAKAVPSKNDK